PTDLRGQGARHQGARRRGLTSPAGVAPVHASPGDTRLTAPCCASNIQHMMNLARQRARPPLGTAPDIAVRARGLRVVRGERTVLDDFDLEVRQGTLTGLLGPSGSGKSTLMRAIVGVQKVAGGTIEVLGQPAGSKPLRHRVGYVTQSPSV